MVSGGELLVNLFEECGIEYIFCSPGTEWTPVWEALIKRQANGNNSLKYINCRHEILAVSMAQGYAETTGRLPAVLLHSSVGALSGALAIRNAWLAREPMLIFSGETCEHCGDDEVAAQGWHWLGLLSDIAGPAGLVRDYVKWSNAVKSRDGLADLVSRGSRIALNAPRGPVFISIPTEVLLKGGGDYKASLPAPPVTPLEPGPAELKEVAQALINSRQPVIIAEHAGKKPGVVERLVDLAGLLGIPVFESTLPYTSNFPKENPLYMGWDTSEAFKEADTVFVVGGLTPWYPPAAGPHPGAKVIMLDEDPLHERLPHWGYRADIIIPADIEKTLAALNDVIRKDLARGKESEAIRERKQRWQAKHDAMLSRLYSDAVAGKDNKPISARWFLHEAKRIFPADAVILDETILHTRSVHQYLAEPGRYIKSAYGGLGVGVGEALGVKLARPEQPVILMIGDGAFNYNPALAGLGLSQEYGVPVFIIVFNNGGYVAMKFGHQRMYPEGAAVKTNQFLGADITPAPDYVKIAEAFGAYGEKLTEPGDIEAALKRGLKQTKQCRTALLDVVLEKSPPFMPPPRRETGR